MRPFQSRMSGLLLPAILMALSAAGTHGCRNETGRLPGGSPCYDPTALRGTNALAQVREFLAIGPRPSGSAGAKTAAAYLAERMMRYGLTVSVDEFAGAPSGTNIVFRNILGAAPGRSLRTVILVSHYDTKSGISDTFNGANDSGSSTGLLLELARLIAAAPTREYTVICAFLDGEECLAVYSPTDGLHGSRRLAGMVADRDIRAVIVLDMIGDSDLSVTIPRNCSPHLTSIVFEAARDEHARSQFSLAAGDVLDDHVPFMNAGIPAVDIIDFHYGSAPGRNDYWHTDQDTFDKLSAQSLETVGRVVLNMLNRLAL